MEIILLITVETSVKNITSFRSVCWIIRLLCRFLKSLFSTVFTEARQSFIRRVYRCCGPARGLLAYIRAACLFVTTVT